MFAGWTFPSIGWILSASVPLAVDRYGGGDELQRVIDGQVHFDREALWIIAS